MLSWYDKSWYEAGLWTSYVLVTCSKYAKDKRNQYRGHVQTSNTFVGW